MKTEEEITDWLKANMVSMKDMLEICRVLQNMDIVIPSITTFNTTRKSDYSHFIKWLNSSPKTKFSKGDKVTQNTNIQKMDRVFTIQQVKQEYYGNDWHTRYILDDGRIIKESKLSAYKGKQFDIKIGDWLRCTITNKVFQLYAVDYSKPLRCFVVGDKDAFITHTFEPYSPKEGEFTLVLFREHRRSLADSLATQRNVRTLNDVFNIANSGLFYGRLSDLTCEWYANDDRMSEWKDTYIINALIDDHTGEKSRIVLGFTNKKIE